MVRWKTQFDTESSLLQLVGTSEKLIRRNCSQGMSILFRLRAAVTGGVPLDHAGPVSRLEEGKVRKT